MSENFAPIIVFTYLRLEKLKKLIDNLKQNLDSKNQIFIFLVIMQSTKKT